MTKEEDSIKKEKSKNNKHKKSDKKETKKEKPKKDKQESKVEELNERVAALEKELLEKDEVVKEEKDKALRSFAELENFRKRKEQEVSTFKKYAAEKCITEILPILDSLERACEHKGTDNEKQEDIVEGVKLIKKQFQDTLEKLGINFHQAVLQEEKEGLNADIIIKELQKGYIFHERVIRPSMVVVSK